MSDMKTLYDKLQEELHAFVDSLPAISTSEALSRYAYEFTIKVELAGASANLFLAESELESLLKEDNLLDLLYQEWLSNDYSYMDLIEDTISDYCRKTPPERGEQTKAEPPEVVEGYEIKRSIVFESNRGFALAQSKTAPDTFVTWQFTEDENGGRDYYWGHYKTSGETAARDYELRVSEYHEDHDYSERNAYRYYSTQRPPDIGTFPKTEGGPLIIVAFDKRERTAANIEAWGYLVYDKPLTDKQIADYELRAAPDNPDIAEFERIVTEAVCEEIDAEFANNPPKSIYEQMNESAKQAAKDNAARSAPPKKKEQDISD